MPLSPPPVRPEDPGSPMVLFVCVHNAGRSVAAAVLAAHYGRGRIRVRSAGSRPAAGVNSVVAQVLAERGFDAGEEFPKQLTGGAVEAADVVVTMGCGDTCPFHPGKRYLDWPVEDPAGLPLEAVRPIVDDIDRRVRALVDELVGR